MKKKSSEKKLTNINEKILILCVNEEVLTHLKLVVSDLHSNSFW